MTDPDEVTFHVVKSAANEVTTIKVTDEPLENSTGATLVIIIGVICAVGAVLIIGTVVGLVLFMSSRGPDSDDPTPREKPDEDETWVIEDWDPKP